jgi:hypothetical protein
MVPLLQDQVEEAEPVKAGAAEAADQRGEGATSSGGGPRGGLGLLSPALSASLQLPDHSGRHIPQRHVRARLPTVVPLALPHCFVLVVYLSVSLFSPIHL